MQTPEFYPRFCSSTRNPGDLYVPLFKQVSWQMPDRMKHILAKFWWELRGDRWLGMGWSWGGSLERFQTRKFKPQFYTVILKACLTHPLLFHRIWLQGLNFFSDYYQVNDIPAQFYLWLSGDSCWLVTEGFSLNFWSSVGVFRLRLCSFLPRWGV